MDSTVDAAASTIDLKHLLETVQPPDCSGGNSSKAEKLVSSDLPDFSLAYLGPQLWSDTVMSDDLKLEPINLDELLDEGSLSKDLVDISSLLTDQRAENSQNVTVPAHSSSDGYSSSDGKSMPAFGSGPDFGLSAFNTVQSFAPSTPPVTLPAVDTTQPDASITDKSEVDAMPRNFSYEPDLTDVMISTPLDEADGPSELFDPTKRVFTEEELKPQPIIRKAKKVYVPDDNKDAKYWQKREKNNAAAKRSRAARRIKENQIAMRTTFLEKENNSLRDELKEVRAELQRMIEVVNGYKAREAASVK